MPIKTHTAIFIDRPPEKVFAALMDISRYHEWAQWRGTVCNVTDQPVKLGTRWNQNTKFIGKPAQTDSQVTIFEPNFRFGFKDSKPFPTSLLFSLDPVAKGTKLTCEVETDPHGFFAMTSPLISNAIRKQIHEDIDHLRTLLESRA